MYLNEDLFEDVDVSEDYLVEKQGILASLSNRSYKLKGFWGTSLGKRILDAAKAMGLSIKNYEVHQDLYSDIVNDILTKIVDNFINNHYNTPGHSGIYLVTDLLNQEG